MSALYLIGYAVECWVTLTAVISDSIMGLYPYRDVYKCEVRPPSYDEYCAFRRLQGK